jgi:ABC-type multidrug transport system fused ATPase/permease subunit
LRLRRVIGHLAAARPSVVIGGKMNLEELEGHQETMPDKTVRNGTPMTNVQSPMTVLQFSDVCFAYDRQEVLHNVDLSLPDRSLVAVVGPNGGGKTTLVRLALGANGVKPQISNIHRFHYFPLY